MKIFKSSVLEAIAKKRYKVQCYLEGVCPEGCTKKLGKLMMKVSTSLFSSDKAIIHDVFGCYPHIQLPFRLKSSCNENVKLGAVGYYEDYYLQAVWPEYCDAVRDQIILLSDYGVEELQSYFELIRRDLQEERASFLSRLRDNDSGCVLLSVIVRGYIDNQNRQTYYQDWCDGTYINCESSNRIIADPAAEGISFDGMNRDDSELSFICLWHIADGKGEFVRCDIDGTVRAHHIFNLSMDIDTTCLNYDTLEYQLSVQPMRGYIRDAILVSSLQRIRDMALEGSTRTWKVGMGYKFSDGLTPTVNKCGLPIIMY